MKTKLSNLELKNPVMEKKIQEQEATVAHLLAEIEEKLQEVTL